MPQTKVIRRKPKSRKKYLVLAVLVVLIVLLAYAGIAQHRRYWPFHKTALTAQQTGTGAASPKNDTSAAKSDPKTSDVSNSTSQEVPVSTTLTASITQLEESGNNVLFTGRVTNATSAGTCVVTFSNPNDRPVTKQFTATNDGAVSTCGPTTIPATDFSYLGEWQVEFHYYNGDQQATATSKVTIR